MSVEVVLDSGPVAGGLLGEGVRAIENIGLLVECGQVRVVGHKVRANAGEHGLGYHSERGACVVDRRVRFLNVRQMLESSRR